MHPPVRGQRASADEAFGSFCTRVGLKALQEFAETYECKHPCLADLQMPAMVVRPMFEEA